ncbi:MAG: hypothetical protein ACPKPY_00905 [Nitrososphaeraceae archaeon]
MLIGPNGTLHPIVSDFYHNDYNDVENNPYLSITLVFLSNKVYCTEYESDIFMGTVDDIGNKLFHFDLIRNKIESDRTDDLGNKDTKEKSMFTYAELCSSFNRITDLEVNPYDDYLYVAYTSIKDSYDFQKKSTGKIFRLISNNVNKASSTTNSEENIIDELFEKNNNIIYPSYLDNTVF